MEKKYFIYRSKEPVFQKEVTLFRKNFAYKGGKVVIAVTADTRYLLYVNGNIVCRGPETGDAYRKYYDEVDITEYLKEGANCIGVKVIHYPLGDEGIQQFAFGPTAYMRSVYGGLCVFCTEGEADIYTDKSWKWLPDASYGFKDSRKARQAGDMERIQAGAYETCWSEADYDDSTWKDSVEVIEADEERPYTIYGILYNWLLKKRDIPREEEISVRPMALYNQKGVDFGGLLTGTSVEIPPHTEAVCDIEMGRLTTAFVRSDFRKGGQAHVEYTYSECYYHEQDGALVKRQRDDWENGILDGEEDELFLGEGAFVYEPFEYRTFRYLRLKIQTGEEGAVLGGMNFRETSYPFHPVAEFTADNSVLEDIWKVSLHTLRCCMHDTYIDCPFYERLQYTMDTMIEAYHTYSVLGDDRLPRKALLDFASSQMADGMIYCDIPANDRHIIPGFGIYYIDMLRQHYQYYGDAELVKQYWTVCAGILNFFGNHVDKETGLVMDCGYWEFVDWTNEWDATQGVPVNCRLGEKQHVYSLMYAYGLLKMAELTEAVYGAPSASMWRDAYEKMRTAINAHLWDPEKGYYITSTRGEEDSQHAQVWAVMSECIVGEEATALMQKVLGDDSLIRCSYCMKYYFNMALEKAGVEEQNPKLWSEYEALMKSGSTTWPEDPVTARSDCHGWSSIPISEIAHRFLGIKPEAPGFASVIIEPIQLAFGSMKGKIWTPQGMIMVERVIENQADGRKVTVRFELEKELPVTVKVAGRELLKGCCAKGECSVVIR